MITQWTRKKVLVAILLGSLGLAGALFGLALMLAATYYEGAKVQIAVVGTGILIALACAVLSGAGLVWEAVRRRTRGSASGR